MLSENLTELLCAKPLDAHTPIESLLVQERVEDLKVAWHSRLHAVPFRIGERPASLLFGLIDDLARFADLQVAHPESSYLATVEPWFMISPSELLTASVALVTLLCADP
jgi:hypothetical protein